MNPCILRVSRVSMGTEFQAILVGSDPDYLRDAGREALEEVDRLEARLSHYRRDSEITDLNIRAPHGPVLLEPSLFELLQRAVAYSQATDAAFDPAVGALIRCWGFFRGQGKLADADAVRQALEVSGSRYIALDAAERTVHFDRAVQVHLGAIGKGYAVDRVVEVLRELRIPAALVHGGTSTVYALGVPPGRDAWVVGLCDPDDRRRRLGVVKLRDRALSTSGDYEQFFEADGRRYSHILDPRIGFPSTGTRSATVLADNATDTDALSTAAFVLGDAGAPRLVERFPGIGILMVPDRGAEGEREVLRFGDAVLAPEADGPDNGEVY